MRDRFPGLATASPAVIAAGLALVHLLAAAFAFDPSPHSGGDNAAYIALARSLLEHGRYLQIWDPAAAAHAQYPPGFPALLAGAMAVGITPWIGLKALIVLISGLAVALSYRWLRAATDPALALGAGLLLALAPGIVRASHWILSDIPFWAATMGALWFAARDRVPAAAGMAFVALLFRTAALPLVVAVALWLALRRRWAWAAGVLGLLAVLGLAWTLRAAGSEVAYASDLWLASPYEPDRGTIGLAGLVARIGENASMYGFGLFMETLTGADGVLADAIAGALLALAAVGWGRRLRAPGVAELLLPLYLGMILLWPAAWAGARLLIPVLPLLLIYAAEGAGVLPWRAPAAVRIVALATLLAMAVPGIYTQWRWGAGCRRQSDPTTGACVHPSLRPFLALAGWTRDRLPEGAAALSRKPTLFYHFSGVPGRVYPFTQRTEALFEEAERAGARYVVVDRLGPVSAAYLLPVLARHPDRFCIVQAADVRGEEAALLGILPDAAGGAAGGGAARREDDGYALEFPVCPREYFGPAYSPAPSAPPSR